MALPAPNLDDRRFQNLVDDAKRMVQSRCPEWTDHNVSDPGVTLIETFAYMTDQLLYRLNRVPDRNYLRFLDLIGLRLFPPTPATTSVTFWLAVPQPETISVSAGTAVATSRSDGTDSISFTTVDTVDMVPCSMEYVTSVPTGGTWRNHTDAIRLSSFTSFSPQPSPDDVLMIGLSAAVPRCAVSLRFECSIEGIGVDPVWPPLVWEAYDGSNWVECELERDTTGGLNRNGEVVIHVPPGHAMALEHQLRAGWVRARITTPEEDQPFYSASPLIHRIEAATVGGTTTAVQAEVIEGDVIGGSEGVAGQRFQITHSPMVPSDEAIILEVADEIEGWQEWTEVSDFASSGPADRVFTIDRVTGEVSLGPVVRMPDGSLVQYGAVPAKGSVLRLRRYFSGGGKAGNVSARTIRVMKRNVPFVSRVENRTPATGGTDGETVEEAKERGPILMRTLGRAVTVDDFEVLAREAAPEAARVKAVPAATEADAGGVRVLVVPSVSDDEEGRLSFEQLVPPPELLSKIASFLDSRRTIGTRVVVEPPAYQGVTVVALMRARPWADAARLRSTAMDALYAYLHPLTGGLEGNGWPFGRPVHMGEIYGLLQRLPGTELVEDVRLFAANPITGQRGQAAQRVEVAPNALVFSYEHQVRVEED
jgi:predicted phage baseplate assembly protein